MHSSASEWVTPLQCTIPDNTAVLLLATAVFKLKLLVMPQKHINLNFLDIAQVSVNLSKKELELCAPVFSW